MRHGAKLLFAFALVQFLVGLVPLVIAISTETGQMAENHGYYPDASAIPFTVQLQILFSSVSGALFPFFGALLIDRLDRWLAKRDGEGGE
jgi:hypothetical protein